MANTKPDEKRAFAGLKSLNLSSNMISGEGMELLLDDLITNKSLEILDLGVLDSSTKKNSLGLQGAVCISALLIRNKFLQQLIINDNDIGTEGGESIGAALAQNSSLKVLKISENDLKSEGAISIIKAGTNLEILQMSKNYLKSDCGKFL